jgi:hypothetical protein
MKLTNHISDIKTIRSTDKDFYIFDGPVMAARAGLEISPTCPKEYRTIIQQALRYGYIKPVAHIKKSELTWEKLSS